MANARQEKIMRLMDVKGEVHLSGLREVFPEVSLMTLRRDLTSLENEGLVIRTHGGAVSSKRLSDIKGEEDAYSRRASENSEAKMAIAAKAITLIESGRSIYFDAGSTVMFMAQAIQNGYYTIITSGANIALELVKKGFISVVTPGGLVNPNTLSMSGPSAVNFLESVNIDLAFMSASGFSVDNGFTVANLYEAELKRKIVQRAKKIIMLADSSKINKNLPFTYAEIKDINIWICEKKLPEDVMQQLDKFDVQLL